jgi:hypothetical protein
MTMVLPLLVFGEYGPFFVSPLLGAVCVVAVNVLAR